MPGLNLPAGRLILVAAVAGVAAGALALYVTGGPSGNTEAGRTADARGAADAGCTASAERAAQVGEMARGEVAAMLAAQEARSLSHIRFNDPEGAPVSVADFEGRTLLVNLWATWCAPCRAEMPALDRLEREMGGESFEVVAVNIDTGSDEKPRAFLDEIGVSALGYYRDATMGVFNDLKREGLVVGLPATLLIDGQGCLLGHMNGPAEWASEDAKRLVEAALAG
jgi:thiol-disulfide isomerase/thioredoxin